MSRLSPGWSYDTATRTLTSWDGETFPAFDVHLDGGTTLEVDNNERTLQEWPAGDVDALPDPVDVVSIMRLVIGEPMVYARYNDDGDLVLVTTPRIVTHLDSSDDTPPAGVHAVL